MKIRVKTDEDLEELKKSMQELEEYFSRTFFDFDVRKYPLIDTRNLFKYRYVDALVEICNKILLYGYKGKETKLWWMKLYYDRKFRKYNQAFDKVGCMISGIIYKQKPCEENDRIKKVMTWSDVYK